MKKPLEVLGLYPKHDYTLHGALESRASRDASRAFILFGERTWSWQAFDEAVRGIASR
jgi:non-ribosomal peptide synthetase component E (peptide arylation enzyme)